MTLRGVGTLTTVKKNFFLNFLNVLICTPNSIDAISLVTDLLFIKAVSFLTAFLLFFDLSSRHHEVFSQAEIFPVLVLPLMKTFLVSHLHVL